MASQQEMQKTLEDVIDDLANDSNILNKEDEYVNKLKLLYENRFIHLYSRFYSKIEALSFGDVSVIQTIGQNLDILECFVLDNYYNPLLNEDINKYEKESKVYKQILKFCDHLRLEIARRNTYNNYKKISDDLNNTYTNTKNEVDALTETAAEISSKADETLKKVDNAVVKVDKMNMDVVTVLGIFAAIIMAFAGGFSFLDGTIKALSTNVNIVKLLIMAFGCGAIIFNLIYFLLFGIGKLTNKEIFEHWRVILIIDGVLLLVGVLFYFGYLYFNPTIINQIYS